MDLVPLAGHFEGPGQGHDVPGETVGDDDQPSQLILLNVRAGRSQGILTVLGRLNLSLDQL